MSSSLVILQKKAYEMLDKLNDLKDNHILSEDMYHKELIFLAYDLAKEDHVDEALSMILRIDKKYFMGVQEEQAKDDPLYKEIILKLADKIKDSSKPIIIPTQDPAEA
ncbi:MAG: hypothetical protein KGO96_07240 [Elusimicrobia bacterium]|nr:hypothetical protein [Elusimicrobiota bacterium]